MTSSSPDTKPAAKPNIGAGTREARLRREEASRIAADNARQAKCAVALSRKLEAIKKEAPGAFHAPLGSNSLKGARRPGSAPPGVRDQVRLTVGTTTRLAPSVWPPPARIHTESAATWRDGQAAMGPANRKLQEHLEVKYRHALEFVKESGKPPVKALDLRATYRLRTGLYDRVGPGTDPSSAADVTGVPRTLAVAQCSGCGRKSFWGADGHALSPCHECGKVFYCSHACAVLDWTSHKTLCAYSTTGVYNPSRPMGEYWIGSSSQAVERDLLAQRTSLWPDGGATASIARRGKEADALAEKRQARVEEAAKRAEHHYRAGQMKF